MFFLSSSPLAGNQPAVAIYGFPAFVWKLTASDGSKAGFALLVFLVGEFLKANGEEFALGKSLLWVFNTVSLVSFKKKSSRKHLEFVVEVDANGLPSGRVVVWRDGHARDPSVSGFAVFLRRAGHQVRERTSCYLHDVKGLLLVYIRL